MNCVFYSVLIDDRTKIECLKLINTEHLKSSESPSIKASEETFTGPTDRTAHFSLLLHWNQLYEANRDLTRYIFLSLNKLY